MSIKGLFGFLLCICISEVAAAQISDTSQSKMRLDSNNHLRSNLDETVVTGLAKPVRLQNALSQYRVITKAAMQAQGATSVADALSTQLNINLSNDGILGSSMSMQGLGGDKVKILVDGLPVNGRENGNIDLGQLSLNNVARIEIVQGPMSVLYGSDALGGVINIITFRSSKKYEGSVGMNYESYGKYNVDIAGALKINKRNAIQAGAGRNFSDAYGYLDTTDPKRSRIFKPKEQWLGNVVYTYTAPKGWVVNLASDFVQENITNRGPVIGWPYSATAVDEYYHTTRSNNRLTISGKSGTKGLWRFDNGYAYYRRNRESHIKDLVSLVDTPSTSSGSQDTSRFDDITLRSNYSNSWKKIRYNGGYDLLFQHGISGKFGGLSHNSQDYPLYANISTSFLKDKLSAQLGLREAYNSVVKAPLIYAFNLLYIPVNRMQFRASYAKGFRTPSLKEQYLEFIDQNHHVIGNPNLKPEYGDHIQASASWQYRTSSGIHGGVTATGFYNDVHDEISLANPDPDPASISRIYANIARQRNAIGNIQAEGEWKNWYVLAGGGITHTFGADSSYNSFNSVEATANLRYTIRPLKTSFSLFYKYTGQSRQLSALPDGTALYDVELPGYHFMDVSLSRRFYKNHIDCSMGIKNIFDVTALTPTGTISSGAHSGNGGNFLPRRFFVTLRLSL